MIEILGFEPRANYFSKPVIPKLDTDLLAIVIRMRKPLELPDTEIIRIANSRFGRSFVSLEFIPLGEASWLYRAAETDGARFVIKIQHDVDAAPAEVLAQLAEATYSWVPQSYFTKDSLLWAKEGDLYFSVQQYIPVDSLHHAASEPDTDFLHELGRALVELHHRIPDISKLPHVRTEDFYPSVFNSAKQLINQLDSMASAESNITRVQQVFKTQRENIDRLFANMVKYGAVLEKNSPKNVLVHGDTHFGNILKPQDDHIYLIDWDHAMFAQPEMDLMYYTDEQIKIIGETYGRDLLENEEAVQYYRNFLLVRAIDFFLERLFDPRHASDESIPESMEEIFNMSPYFKRALQ